MGLRSNFFCLGFATKIIPHRYINSPFGKVSKKSLYCEYKQRLFQAVSSNHNSNTLMCVCVCVCVSEWER